MNTAALAQSLPITDWQFWVVTAIVLAVLTVAIRRTLRTPAKKRSTRVTLTITRDKDAADRPDER
jgi:hypothetical protein